MKANQTASRLGDINSNIKNTNHEEIKVNNFGNPAF